MRQNIIAGNWKMNCTVEETESLISALLKGSSSKNKAKVVVCPPFTSLESANKLLTGSHIALGAQNMSEHEKGAYTSEISKEMLLTVGVSFVILGHSELRQYHAETDQLVNVKAKAALEVNLTPIICVGETLSDRDNGQTESVVKTQIEASTSGFSAEMLKELVVAYEPVWAIGTGKTATPDMAQEVHRFIREQLAVIDKDAANVVPILYGGSVKASNAAELLSQPDIDGALVGGAALKAEDFIGIINSV